MPIICNKNIFCSFYLLFALIIKVCYGQKFCEVATNVVCIGNANSPATSTLASCLKSCEVDNSDYCMWMEECSHLSDLKKNKCCAESNDCIQIHGYPNTKMLKHTTGNDCKNIRLPNAVKNIDMKTIISEFPKKHQACNTNNPEMRWKFIGEKICKEDKYNIGNKFTERMHHFPDQHQTHETSMQSCFSFCKSGNFKFCAFNIYDSECTAWTDDECKYNSIDYRYKDDTIGWNLWKCEIPNYGTCLADKVVFQSKQCIIEDLIATNVDNICECKLLCEKISRKYKWCMYKNEKNNKKCYASIECDNNDQRTDCPDCTLWKTRDDKQIDLGLNDYEEQCEKYGIRIPNVALFFFFAAFFVFSGVKIYNFRSEENNKCVKHILQLICLISFVQCFITLLIALCVINDSTNNKITAYFLIMVFFTHIWSYTVPIFFIGQLLYSTFRMRMF